MWDLIFAGDQGRITYVGAMEICVENKIIRKFSEKKRIIKLKIHSLHDSDKASPTISKIFQGSLLQNVSFPFRVLLPLPDNRSSVSNGYRHS